MVLSIPFTRGKFCCSKYKTTDLHFPDVFFFSFLTEEVDILLTVTGRGEGWYLPHKRDSDREMMGSTYLHVQVVGFFFKILRSYKRSIKQVAPPPFYYSPVYSPTAVMDVQILGGEDSGLSITTS